jgi:hypothetical protein
MGQVLVCGPHWAGDRKGDADLMVGLNNADLDVLTASSTPGSLSRTLHQGPRSVRRDPPGPPEFVLCRMGPW